MRRSHIYKEIAWEMALINASRSSPANLPIEDTCLAGLRNIFIVSLIVLLKVYLNSLFLSWCWWVGQGISCINCFKDHIMHPSKILSWHFLGVQAGKFVQVILLLYQPERPTFLEFFMTDRRRNRLTEKHNVEAVAAMTKAGKSTSLRIRGDDVDNISAFLESIISEVGFPHGKDFTSS